MPAYDFKCCDNLVTIVAGITEKIDPPVCLNCQSEMKKDYGLLGVSFKGQGFYSTDTN
jgi:predicted nucleic acid-binding Zn ribbon protein